MLDIKTTLDTYCNNPLLKHYAEKFKSLLDKCDLSELEPIDNEILLFNKLIEKYDLVDDNIIYEDDIHKITDIETHSQLLQSGLFDKKRGSFLNEWFFKLYFQDIKKCIAIIKKHKTGNANDVICICVLNKGYGFITNLNNNELPLTYTNIAKARYFNNDEHFIGMINEILDETSIQI